MNIILGFSSVVTIFCAATSADTASRNHTSIDNGGLWGNTSSNSNTTRNARFFNLFNTKHGNRNYDSHNEDHREDDTRHDSNSKYQRVNINIADSNDRHGNNDRGGHTHRGDNDRPTSRAKIIHGTNLKTRTFYKLGIKSFPNGVIRWTPQTNQQQGFHYVHIDNNREHRNKYERDGEWSKDAQWEFVPVSSDERSHWYKLRNRARPREYLTWSVTEFVNEEAHANYLILDGNYPGRRSRRDFLFRPVKPKGHNDHDDHNDRHAGEYYQLRLRELPKGVITWSDREFQRDTKYIEVDVHKNEDHMQKYQKGHSWYEDTLFSIELAERDDIDDNEDIEESNDSDVFDSKHDDDK